eukprot:5737788-Pleurochrysis_carterae.AAC.2
MRRMLLLGRGVAKISRVGTGTAGLTKGSNAAAKGGAIQQVMPAIQKSTFANATLERPMSHPSCYSRKAHGKHVCRDQAAHMDCSCLHRTDGAANVMQACRTDYFTSRAQSGQKIKNEACAVMHGICATKPQHHGKAVCR